MPNNVTQPADNQRAAGKNRGYESRPFCRGHRLPKAVSLGFSHRIITGAVALTALVRIVFQSNPTAK